MQEINGPFGRRLEFFVMRLSGFDIEVYSDLKPENWCLCQRGEKLLLEIYLPYCELSKRVDNDNTRQSVAAKYRLPILDA